MIVVTDTPTFNRRRVVVMEQELKAVFAPVRGVLHGFNGFLRGLSWLRSHPGYLLLLFIPMLLGATFMAGGLWAFNHYAEDIFAWALFQKPEVWWGVIVWYFAKVLLYAAIFILCLLASVLLVNVVAAPFYELVSVAVERDFSGGQVAEVSFWKSLKLVGEELKKVFFILSVSLVLLLIPGVNILALMVTAVLTGWDLYDYPAARRGWTFRQRLGFMLKDIWTVMGFGVWLLIPFLQIFIMPLAVAGGTLLNLEELKKRHLLTVTQR